MAGGEIIAKKVGETALSKLSDKIPIRWTLAIFVTDTILLILFQFSKSAPLVRDFGQWMGAAWVLLLVLICIHQIEAALKRLSARRRLQGAQTAKQKRDGDELLKIERRIADFDSREKAILREFYIPERQTTIYVHFRDPVFAKLQRDEVIASLQSDQAHPVSGLTCMIVEMCNRFREQVEKNLGSIGFPEGRSPKTLTEKDLLNAQDSRPRWTKKPQGQTPQISSGETGTDWSDIL